MQSCHYRRKPLRTVLQVLLVFAVALGAGVSLYANGEGEDSRRLVINSNLSDPAPKADLAEAVEMFRAEYPDIEVELNTFDHEAYKTAIRNFLATEPPDVALWFAGNRMKFFVDQGMFEDVSDVWADNGLYDSMASSVASMTVDGKQYGVPYSYYQWGVYYRTDLFEQVGAEVPQNWDQFLDVAAKLKAAGITPVTIGTKFLWTAAGWFDYLNLRINGLDYHISLTDGEASYLDPELDAVFATWRELLDRGYFLQNHATYSWQEAQAPLINGSAAMYLIGNFIVPDLENAGVVDNVGYFQFPIINPDAGVYEDAPTDTFHMPSGAENKDTARLFLAFIARPDVQVVLTSGSLPPNNQSPAPTDRFKRTGFQVLSDADGLAQFYDRDTHPEMAATGMEGFQEFMVNPDRLPEIRARLEEKRLQVFG